jgi:hypothetical protein
MVCSITEKLEELGFAEELNYLDSLIGFARPTPPLTLFDNHPDVKVNKPLTERSKCSTLQNYFRYTYLT